MFARNPILEKYLGQISSTDEMIAKHSMRKIAKALELPLRQGIMDCDIVSPIYETLDYRGRECVQLPLDFLQPGMENDFTAYAVPDCSCFPINIVQGEYVMIPYYAIGNSIDWCWSYVKKASWDVVSRATEVGMNGVVKKENDDGWHAILAAGADRGILVHNPDAPAGYFSKALLAQLMLVMRRNGGGNTGCLNRFKVTDAYMSPEAMASIRSWPFSEVDDTTRREILTNNGDQGLNGLFGANLHELDELGVGQEYQDYWTNDLGKGLPGGSQEIGVALDLSKNNSFVSPIVSELEIMEDVNVRCRRTGLIFHKELGYAVLDSRNVLIFSV